MELAFDSNQKEQENFNLLFKNVILKIRRQYVSNQVIFQVYFPDDTTPLILTRATGLNQNRFWTSIPQGRQQEAEEIGPLISAYILSTQS